VEEQMMDRWLGFAVVLLLVGLPGACLAEQFAGTLVRVDLTTVTIIGSNNKRFVMHVDGGKRREAAPYLGKSVSVEFRNDNGECKAVGFRSAVNAQK